MPGQRTRANVVSCSELIPMNHSTQLPHSAEDTRGISESRCIILPLQDLFFFIHFTPQGTSLFFREEFVGKIATVNESRMQFMLLYEHSPSQHRFTLVAMVYFCSKRYFAKYSFQKTLRIFLSPYPSEFKTNNGNLNCHHSGAWLFLRRSLARRTNSREG